ncbi:hypothetical protein CALCODRAFT_510176 [Calocera cornea HHB12733]|uniref:Uncharacterized protein n=1 Tax=Calocera cornea HHB12733 TaxID=1353952 RepID=A0A165ERL5_9BASI|nr:hypothetical protein CALCODRAFT_510176 [Calocera cornea HHB12733]
MITFMDWLSIPDGSRVDVHHAPPRARQCPLHAAADGAGMNLGTQASLPFRACFGNLTRRGALGFWVLTYKGNPIELVVVGTHPLEEVLRSPGQLVKEAEVDEDVRGYQVQEGKDGKKDDGKKLDHSRITRPPAPTEPTIALVRHFHLDAPYCPTFIQNDLLAHGLSQAFAGAPSLETAYFRVSKLTPWLEEVSKTMGMRRRAGPTGEELAKDVGRRGLMGWREWYVGVGREKWEERYEEMREMHGL